MQSNEEKFIDTRSLVEIYSSLTSSQRMELRNRLLVRARVSPATPYNWCTGRNVPVSYSTRKLIMDVTEKFLGTKLSMETLF